MLAYQKLVARLATSFPVSLNVPLGAAEATPSSTVRAAAKLSMIANLAIPDKINMFTSLDASLDECMTSTTGAELQFYLYATDHAEAVHDSTPYLQPGWSLTHKRPENTMPWQHF
jgi:hypothetical protein